MELKKFLFASFLITVLFAANVDYLNSWMNGYVHIGNFSEYLHKTGFVLSDVMFWVRAAFFGVLFIAFIVPRMNLKMPIVYITGKGLDRKLCSKTRVCPARFHMTESRIFLLIAFILLLLFLILVDGVNSYVNGRILIDTFGDFVRSVSPISMVIYVISIICFVLTFLVFVVPRIQFKRMQSLDKVKEKIKRIEEGGK